MRNTTRRFIQECNMNFCYLDESGTGNEPIATMVGILVDSGRMHLTKKHWEELLDILSSKAGKEILELHTANFYSGNGVWRNVDAETRVQVTEAILEWIALRKHHIIYTSVLKSSFFEALKAKEVPPEIRTPYQFMAFHIALAVQRYSQPEKKNKGNTVLIFDNEERDRVKLSEMVSNPPAWSDKFYERARKQKALDQIVDVPYWGDSKEVCLLQLADFLAFFLRKYAEIEESLVIPKYDGERERIRKWIRQMKDRCIDAAHIYPRRRNDAQELFHCHAPNCIREL